MSAGNAGSGSPCAACKFLRRKCTEDCVFAPYFPGDNPDKFSNVHRVFGASNVSKILKDLDASQRLGAANALAFEAEFRLRDPVNGCVGQMYALQQRMNQLYHQLHEANMKLAAYRSMFPVHPQEQQEQEQQEQQQQEQEHIISNDPIQTSAHMEFNQFQPMLLNSHFYTQPLIIPQPHPHPHQQPQQQHPQQILYDDQFAQQQQVEAAVPVAAIPAAMPDAVVPDDEGMMMMRLLNEFQQQNDQPQDFDINDHDLGLI